jgi:hypothetical protein
MKIKLPYIFLSALLSLFTGGFGAEDVPASSSSNIITNILIQTNQFSAVLYWSGLIDSSPETRISLYRTAYKITNSNELRKIRPYRLLTNGFYYEDTCVSFGVPYYYLIIVDENSVILPGKNENKDPVIIGLTNPGENIGKEVLSRTNETYEDFIKKFNY